jgi:DNA-nicking Smr family endonuclease
MGRRRKRGREAPEAPKSKQPPPEAVTSLAALMKAASLDKLSKPAPARPNRPETKAPLPPKPPPPKPAAPPAPTSATELRLLNDAYDGARPLVRKGARHVTVRPNPLRMSEVERAEEAAARKRLAALVSGGVHFKVRREDEFVEAWRSEGSNKVVLRLSSKGFVPEATLDLHGERAARVSDVVANFVRLHHRRGARHMLIIVGKGLHSEDGVGVLLPALIDALVQGLAAPLVRAFASAHAVHGGTGAVAVLLI